jgi:hypothetical protein
MPSSAGDRDRVQPPGAAEGQQREVARVEALLDGHHPQRPDHLGVGDADDALGRRQQVVTERAERADRALGGLASSATPPASGVCGVEQAEHEVRVGDRRLGARRAVAGGPRLGARRARSDAQSAARVAPGDRAAPGADRVDVDHRQRERPPADLASAGLAHAAALDDADVARGAAHVEAQRSGVPLRAASRAAGGGAAAGPLRR